MQISNYAQSLSPSLTLAMGAKAKAMKAEGINVIGFAAGEPDFDTPEHIKAAAMGSLDAGFTKYTPASGIPELREAIAEKFQNENALDYQPSDVIVTPGGKYACYVAFAACLNPGDEVLIPTPYWTSYPEMVKLAGGEPILVPTSAENGYKLTPDQFLENMSPKTEMVIINSPGNPTGTVYTENELAALAEVALDDEIMILSDEIYEKMIYDDAKHASIASFSNEVFESTITVNGFSKAYAMTGWRLGYLGAPSHVAKAIGSIVSHTTSNPTSFAQKGAMAAIKGPQDCVEEMCAEYDKRRKRMCSLIDEIPTLSYTKPEGAFYVFVDISSTGMDSGDFADRLLEEQKVAVVPGIAFGDDSSIRLSYATSLEDIEEGIARIKKFVL